MKKSLTIGLAVTAVAFLLVYISLFLKLLQLGTSTFSGDLGPGFLPFGHIETSPDGFTVENKLGSIVIPLILGGLAVAWHYFTRRPKPAPRAN